MPPTIDPKFRVIRIPDSLRDAIKTAREARETTNAALIEAAVNGNLEDLTTALQALGFESDDVPKRPARYQISDGLQGELREASQAVNVPATQLLAICLRRETSRPVAGGSRGGRRKRRKSESEATPRKRRRRKAAEA